VRTFPKELAGFREMVNARGEALRKLPLEDLKRLNAEPTEHVTVGARPATISVIVLDAVDGGVQVVVQGFMKARLIGKDVALDGFYKHPDGSVSPMHDKEFYAFD